MLYGFDTEDDSKGSIYWINFYDGMDHYSFKTRADAIEFLGTHPGKYWATNLEYDLCNIFGDDLAACDWHFGKNKLIWARYKRAYFYDSLNHWKYSVEQMGEKLCKPKMPFDPTNRDYCRMDTEITYDFVNLMGGLYEKIGAKVKSTVASTALNHWEAQANFRLKSEWRNGEKASAIPADTLGRFRLSYYGGRTECFFIGKMEAALSGERGLHNIDVNSMYPFCMLGKFPNPYSCTPKIRRNAYGITCARVKSNMKIPILPYREDTGRLIFPNGTFTGVWTNEELNYFEDQGGKVLKEISGYTFNLECEPFRAWVLKLYEMRRKSKDEFERLALKGLMNNLYGKFGQGNERTILMTREAYAASKYRAATRLFQGKFVIFNNEGEYPYQTNFIFPAYVTTRARIVLHQFMLQVIKSGGKLLYCDTDSLVFEGKLDGLPISDELGSFKLEKSMKDFHAKTSKVYTYTSLDDTPIYKCKGVPSKEQKKFFVHGAATFQKPLRLREALRRDMRPNIWIESSKAYVEEYSKGRVGKNGDVKPFTLKG